MNAVNPSVVSIVVKSSANSSCSFNIPCFIDALVLLFTNFIVDRIEIGAFPAIDSANFSEAGINSVVGKTLFTNPIEQASFAAILLPLKRISSALPLPTNPVSLWVPPKPAINPMPTSGYPKTALSDAYRIWQAMANSQPPPKAYPFTAAITGIGNSSILTVKS